ncbi:hypothetical protein MKX03_024188 [Papaver bracteatum]|nr:hypothetical protein MKX03_024188 [Papaver bracteatum]
MYASTAISTGIKGATKAMTAMNRQMAPTKQAKVIKEFSKHSSQMDMTVRSTPYIYLIFCSICYVIIHILGYIDCN